MHAYFAHYLPHFREFGAFQYWIVFAIALLESLAFVGLLVPGTVLLAATGILLARGHYNMGIFFTMTALGGFVGDAMSYYIGVYAGHHIMRRQKIIKQELIQDGHKFFKKFGGMSIVIGRFVGPMRPLVPIIAGTLGMSQIKFLIYNIISALLWAGGYTVIIHYFADYLDRIENLTTRVFLLFAISGIAYYILKQNNRPSSHPHLAHLDKK